MQPTETMSLARGMSGRQTTSTPRLVSSSEKREGRTIASKNAKHDVCEAADVSIFTRHRFDINRLDSFDSMLAVLKKSLPKRPASRRSAKETPR